MLVNSVIVNESFIATPREEIKLNGRNIDLYYLSSRNDVSNYFYGKLLVPARASRKMVIEKALARIRQLGYE